MELDKAVNDIKEQESERVGYMTYAMKMLEEREDGRREGVREGEKRGKTQMVLELLKAKQPTALIAQVSKFTVEQIAKIGKDNGIALS
ncbi:MAG: hypothetical protein J6O04_00585 [Selenomonadaceae bacterium]|nr:hypothetical protein [Selenomonadaceae bacterium]